MRILKHNQENRTVKLQEETEGRRFICNWVQCASTCLECPVNEYVDESKKRFPDGLTYDEAYQFLEDK